MSELSVEHLTLAGFSLVALVIWLVQTSKESFGVPGRYLPLLALGAAMALLAVAMFAPAHIAAWVGGSLALAAVASMSIRYAKRGDDDNEGTAP